MTEPPEGDYQCRICLGNEQDRWALMAPCKCTGSMALVHRKCIDDWRRAQVTAGDIYASTKCQTCNAHYIERQGGWYVLRLVMWFTLDIGSRAAWFAVNAISIWAVAFTVTAIVRIPRRPTWALVGKIATETNTMIMMATCATTLAYVLPRVTRLLKRIKAPLFRVLHEMYELPYILDTLQTVEKVTVPDEHASDHQATPVVE